MIIFKSNIKYSIKNIYHTIKIRRKKTFNFLLKIKPIIYKQLIKNNKFMKYFILDVVKRFYLFLQNKMKQTHKCVCLKGCVCLKPMNNIHLINKNIYFSVNYIYGCILKKLIRLRINIKKID